MSGLSPESLKEVVQEGFRVNVIEQTESGYAFIHDKIHEALLSQIQETQRKTIYQKAAEALDSLPDDHSVRRSYQLARYYSRGEPDKNPKRVYEVNLKAGESALEQNSYEEAFEFLTIVCKTVEQFQLSLDLRNVYMQLASSCNRMGRLQDTQAYLEKAKEGTTDPEVLAKIHYLAGESYGAASRFEEAAIELKQGLKLLGQPFPRNTWEQ